jgi:hypothetical protein
VCVTISHGRPGFFINGPRGQKSIKVQAASIIFITLVKASLLAIQKLVRSVKANYNAATSGSFVLCNWRLGVGHASSYCMLADGLNIYSPEMSRLALPCGQQDRMLLRPAV